MKRIGLIAAIVVGLALIVCVLIVLPWRWLDPPTTSFIERARAGGQEIRQRWVEWDDMSPHLPIAVVAAEDQNFPHHRGFDLESIRSVLEKSGGRGRGASTISQQVAKNLYLWPGRSWVRKGLEAHFAALIEMLWPKQRILEVYLNIAEFGPGIYGVGAASEAFFGKTAARLSPREAALLAVVLPSPKRMSPANPSDYVEGRVEWTLEQMQQLGGPSYLADL